MVFLQGFDLFLSENPGEFYTVCHLKYPYCCFSSHFCFLVFGVVQFIFILSGGRCNTFFSRTDASTGQCWRVFFLLFLKHTLCLSHFTDVRLYVSPSYFYSLLCIMRMVLQGRLLRCVSCWWIFCCRDCVTYPWYRYVWNGHTWICEIDIFILVRKTSIMSITHI